MSELTITSQRAAALGYSDVQINFVRDLLKTGEIEIAQQNCAMSADDVTLLLESANYDQLLKICVAEVFGKRLIPRALARLSEYGEKGAVPDRGQLDAMKTVLDRAGMIAPKASDPPKNNLEMSEWPVEKLEEFIGIANNELVAKRAPNAQPINPQTIDVLD